jgi:hypothetical protein
MTMALELKDEHRWLEGLVGEWTSEMEAVMEPGKPPSKLSGTEVVRSLGGAWVICEGSGEMPGGGTSKMIMTLGFDPDRGRFTGTFVASMMTHLWVYEGTLDTAANVLTLNTEGPDFKGGGQMAKYQDVIEMRSADHRVLTSRVLGDDGTWTHFMTAHYRRRR